MRGFRVSSMLLLCLFLGLFSAVRGGFRAICVRPIRSPSRAYRVDPAGAGWGARAWVESVWRIPPGRPRAGRSAEPDASAHPASDRSPARCLPVRRLLPPGRRAERSARAGGARACSGPRSAPPRSARWYRARAGSGSGRVGYRPANGRRAPSGHRSEPAHRSSRRCSARHAPAKPPGRSPHARPQPRQRSENDRPARGAPPGRTPAERTARYARESPQCAWGSEPRGRGAGQTRATAQKWPLKSAPLRAARS